MPALPTLRQPDRPRGVLWDLLFGTLRAVRRRVHGLRTAVGVVLLAGVALAALGTAAFAWVATHVRAGRTQGWDEAALRMLAEHRIPVLEQILLEITFLGTATVVMGLAGVVALFLALTRHRASASLLLAATAGSILLNSVLKGLFNRPRPQLFTWGTHALTTSFPSGHAMSAAAVYGTIAYLAARLVRRRGPRVAIFAGASVVILAISFSRLYLGVHYPSDVIAGLIVGLAWAGFCMATLEAVLWYRRSLRRPRRGDVPPELTEPPDEPTTAAPATDG
jgi:membrane-associated phospholipid phosphatase